MSNAPTGTTSNCCSAWHAEPVLQDVLNLFGIAAFAASGALIGVGKRLDIFGVCVVGVTTGIGGGIIRDLLLGIHPPQSFEHWPNVTVAAAASLTVFFAHQIVNRLSTAVVVFDAFGMGLFTSNGALLALDHSAGALAAVLIGATTAIGGGVIRDMLVNEVPLLLHRDLYALPALLGAAAVVLCADHLPGAWCIVVGTVIATGMRCLALWQQWNLPRVGAHDES